MAKKTKDSAQNHTTNNFFVGNGGSVNIDQSQTQSGKQDSGNKTEQKTTEKKSIMSVIITIIMVLAAIATIMTVFFKLPIINLFGGESTPIPVTVVTETPEASVTETPTPTPKPTNTPEPSNTSEPTNTPTPTPEPTNSPTPTPEPDPENNTLVNLPLLLSEFKLQAITTSQIYTGPGTNYIQRTGAKIIDGRNARIYGIIDDWVFIRCQNDTTKKYIYGWVKKEAFHVVHLRNLEAPSFGHNILVTITPVIVRDGTDEKTFQVGSLDAGAIVLGLAICEDEESHKTFVYCEFKNNGNKGRGFIPKEAFLDEPDSTEILVTTTPSPEPTEVQNPATPTAAYKAVTTKKPSTVFPKVPADYEQEGFTYTASIDSVNYSNSITIKVGQQFLFNVDYTSLGSSHSNVVLEVVGEGVKVNYESASTDYYPGLAAKETGKYRLGTFKKNEELTLRFGALAEDVGEQAIYLRLTEDNDVRYGTIYVNVEE